jgi:receptor protein-tyrosine kinase
LQTEEKNTSTHPTSVNKETINLKGERLNERGFIFNSESAHHTQEEFRHIKRKLINNAFGPTAKTLKHSN